MVHQPAAGGNSGLENATGTRYGGLILTGCPDFWRLWSIGLVIFVVRWLETVVVGVVVYDRTESAFLVAMMTMLRLLPMGLFGAFLGAWAEKLERRTTLILVVLTMGANSAALGLLAHAGQLEVWHMALTSFLNGLGWATDNPVRRVMIGDAVGSAHMGTAMSLDVGASNASRMVGPTVGGLLLAGVGIDGAFALSVVLYVGALYAAWRVTYRNSEGTGAGSVIARIAEGLRLVRGDSRLVGVLIVTVIYNLFGWPCASMIPVIGRDRLGLGPEGIGMLASMDGIGAFAGAVLLGLFLKPRAYAHTYIGGVLIYMSMMIVFALTTDPTVAGLALTVVGLGGAGFSTMQATLVYLAAPPEMRSRILGVLSVCIGTGPLGFLGLGVLAELIGAHYATAATGMIGLLTMAATYRWWRTI